MRCPSCQAENDDKSRTCPNCGVALKPRRRPRKRDEVDLPVSPQAETHNRQVAYLYVWCMLALIPVVGLILGPVVAWRARQFTKRAANDPALVGAIPTTLAMWLGVVSSLLSWGGLTSIALGLWLG